MGYRIFERFWERHHNYGKSFGHVDHSSSTRFNTPASFVGIIVVKAIQYREYKCYTRRSN